MRSTSPAETGGPVSRSVPWSAACVAWLGVLGTYAACALLYATAKRHHFFFFDEWIYIENADRDRLEHLFRPYFWYFHPISWRLYFVWLFRRWGPNPAVFLAAQVVLLWTAAALVHVLVHRVTRRHAFGFVANLLYVGANATATNAYWKSCIAYPVAACFEVLFLWVSLEIVLAREGGLRLAGLTLAGIVAYAAAWMSRNNALVLPFALVALWSAGRSSRSNLALVTLIVAAVASLLWYRLDLSPGSLGASEVAKTYRLSNVVASWVSIVIGPPWRVDSELLSFIPGMRWEYPTFTLSRVVVGRLAVLFAVLASLPSLRHAGRPRERFVAFTFVVTAIQLTTSAPFVRDTPQVDRVLYEPAISLAVGLSLTLHRASVGLARALGRSFTKRSFGSGSWTVAGLGGGIAMLLQAHHMAGFGGGDPANTRRWECLWRQTQDVERAGGFGPIVVDRAPTGQARDQVVQFLAMSRLFWRPGGVGAARLGELAPDRPDTLRIYAAGRVYYVEFRPVRSDRAWSGPASCPIPVRSVPVAATPVPDDFHADDATALPQPEIIEQYATAPAESLRRGIARGDWRHRYLSATFLGMRGAEELPTLETALRSDEWYIREAAAQAIALTREGAIPVLRVLLASGDSRDREMGAVVLAQLTVRGSAALDQVARWLVHADPWIRDAARSCWDRSRETALGP